MLQRAEKDALATTIGITGTTDDDYLCLIEFDSTLCSDYDGFKEACDRVNLPYTTVQKFNALWRLLEKRDRA